MLEPAKSDVKRERERAHLMQQEFEIVDVSRLREHPMNPRRGAMSAIERSIASHGFYGAVLAKRDGTVIVGNHRLRAARRLGVKQLPVLFVDIDEPEALRIMFDDNQTSDQARYDSEALIAFMRMLEEAGGSAAVPERIAEIEHRANEVVAAPTREYGTEWSSILGKPEIDRSFLVMIGEYVVRLPIALYDDIKNAIENRVADGQVLEDIVREWLGRLIE